jgi:hypothetical protein
MEIYPIKKDFMFKKILGDTTEPAEELVISHLSSFASVHEGSPRVRAKGVISLLWGR